MEFELLDRSRNALLDKEYDSDSQYKLDILSNTSQPLLNTLNDLIRECDEFCFSVAFISEAGLRGIMVSLDESSAKGRVVIGNKSNFSQPKAIRMLNDNKNIEVRMDMEDNLHTKGYFFRKGRVWTIIIGSSNLTIGALKTNKEWNFIIDSYQDGALVNTLLSEFNYIWDKANRIRDIIEEYEEVYKLNKQFNNEYINKKITPNKMQIEALKGIKEYRENDDCALVISATGTGKTYLSAFDVRDANPKSMLFIVHRENIARKAQETFKRVMSDKEMGIYVAQEKSDAKYLFATIQTISKDEVLSSFSKDHFEYIIIDEVHHVGSKSYQKIIDYFNPKFLLGMSATPQRMDGFNIYEMFKYNIAYEIRLKEAIENKLVVPFHYYGVSEISVDGLIVDEKTKYDMSDKAKHVVSKSKHYGYNGDKVRGLIFIDNIKNAFALEAELRKLGYKVKALSSQDSEKTREDVIKRLKKRSNEEDYLDYIISVDIFNEGIDIPYVNQVILLRATQSIIVYLQQLGRGLRKYNDKSYLVILDFIGNYKNNFMIPLALLDDNASEINKLNMFMESSSELIGGECTISFEYVAKSLVYDKITIKNLSHKKNIIESYNILKQRLNRIPLLYDYYINNIGNPEYILKYKPYYLIVNEVEKEDIYQLSDNEKNFINFLYQEYTPAKRVHEIVIIREMINDNNDIVSINKIIEEYLSIDNQYNNTNNALANLSFNILKLDNTRRKYNPFIINNSISKEIRISYQDNSLFKELVDDFIKYNMSYINENYQQVGEDTLLINHTYTRKEAFYLQNLEYNPGYQVGGYVKGSDNESVMIFMRADNSVYINDIFQRSELVFYSKNNRRIEGDKLSKLEYDMAMNKVKIKVFMKKKDKELDYYLGEARVIDYEQITIDNKPVIKYILKLKEPIKAQVYRYLKEK